VGDRLGRVSGDRQRSRGKRWRRPGGEAVVPPRRADPEAGPAWAVFAGSRASRRQSHRLDGPATGGGSLSRDVAKLALVTASSLPSAQSREDAVDVRHGSRYRSVACPSAGRWLQRLGGQEKVEQQNRLSSQKAEYRSRVPPETIRNQRLKLGGKIGLPSRSGESPAFGEGLRPFVPTLHHQGWRANIGQTRRFRAA
jgi:hypothetical protein